MTSLVLDTRGQTEVARLITYLAAVHGKDAEFASDIADEDPAALVYALTGLALSLIEVAAKDGGKTIPEWLDDFGKMLAPDLFLVAE